MAQTVVTPLLTHCLVQSEWFLIRDNSGMIIASGNDITGLAQYCGNSSANALELPQFCAKPSIYALWTFQISKVGYLHEQVTPDSRDAGTFAVSFIGPIPW